MVNNKDLRYGASLIEGVNNDGEFCSSKANTDDINLQPYKIVNDGDFVYNPSRINIGSLAYRTQGMCIVSHLYVVFHLNEKGIECIVPEYLFLYFKRKEFGRLVTYLNFGSQRPEFNFFQMSDIEIPLPPIAFQRYLVDIYKGLNSVIEQNEALLMPIFAACRAFIIDCKAKYTFVRLVELIELSDERNSEGVYGVDDVAGISILKRIIPTKANLEGVSLLNYKVLNPNAFCYVSVTSRNGEKISIALNNTSNAYLVSSTYIVFNVKDSSVLLPEYLYLLYRRPEFDRYARFNSWGSARETFDWDEMLRLKIPLPPIEVQRSIVSLYHCAYEAQRIIADAKEQLKQLCPALVQLAINYNEKTE